MEIAPNLSGLADSAADSPMLAAALAYARLGWALVPLKPGGKTPCVELLPIDRHGKPSWRLLALSPATEAEVRGWYRRVPDANIGVVLGRLVLVDVDRPPLTPLHLPPTVSSSTGRGSHYLYLSSGPVTSLKAQWGEILGEGHYAVVPPSRHPSGATYTWGDLCSPLHMEPTELPKDLLQQVMDAAEEKRSQTSPRCPSKSISSRAPSPASSSSVLSPDDIYSLLSNEALSIKLLGLCGVSDVVVGKSFRCPLPGHAERSPSAALWRQRDGTIGFHDFHRKSGPEWYSLPEVFASVKSGRVGKLRPAEQITWLLRACVEVGHIRAPSVLAPKLPAKTPAIVADVYEGFRLLLAVRSIYNPDQRGAPFSWQFAADWCGRSKRHTGQALKWLIEHGYIRPVGRTGGKRGLVLYELGNPGEGRRKV